MVRRRAAGGPSATYWRIRFPDGNFNASYLTIAEIEMRATEGGADQCSGGTATASTADASGPAANAFENSTGGYWATTSGNAVNSWIRYQFPAPVSVSEVAITSFTTFREAPRSIVVEYSNDGSSWTTHFSRTCFAWNGLETKVFKASAAYTEIGHRFWRLRFTNGSGGSYLAITEAEFRDSGGTDRSSTAYIVNAGGSGGAWIGATTAFDNTLTTAEAYPPSGQGVNSWIGCQLTGSYDLASVTVRNCNHAGEYPRDVAVEYSDDLTTWTTSWTFTATSGSLVTTTSTKP